jgi:hypothetical protein
MHGLILLGVDGRDKPGHDDVTLLEVSSKNQWPRTHSAGRGHNHF